MSDALTISGDVYTLRGRVTNQATGAGLAGLLVVAYDKDLLNGSDQLGIVPTDLQGGFEVTFKRSAFGLGPFDRKPDLYFEVLDGGTLLLSTESHVISNAGPQTPAITLEVDLSGDKARKDIHTTPEPGWVGGFDKSNPDFAYPHPDLSSLLMLHNLKNIDKLRRQQKVLWPEFSWESEPGEDDPRRCYQMFAPDISRLGYTNEGRVYAIICPQQGVCFEGLGCMNVEVTVTGSRGWADEPTKTLAADMTVEGRIWFGPSAHENPLVQKIWNHFDDNGLPFPSTKLKAIQVQTYDPGNPSQPIFPLRTGESTDFPIPAFARHQDTAWNVGHLGVEIGAPKSTDNAKVDAFNKLVMDAFNLVAGNMLAEGNVLTWNVWFTAPEHVVEKEWHDHAQLWRESLEADHGSPEGDGSVARHFDGAPFKPLKEREAEELAKIVAWIEAQI